MQIWLHILRNTCKTNVHVVTLRVKGWHGKMDQPVKDLRAKREDVSQVLSTYIQNFVCWHTHL